MKLPNARPSQIDRYLDGSLTGLAPLALIAPARVWGQLVNFVENVGRKQLFGVKGLGRKFLAKAAAQGELDLA